MLPAATGPSDEQVLGALRQAVDVQLIDADGVEFRFPHALICDGVLASLMGPEVAALAAQTRRALDAAQPELPGGACVLPAELAEAVGDAEDAASCWCGPPGGHRWAGSADFRAARAATVGHRRGVHPGRAAPRRGRRAGRGAAGGAAPPALLDELAQRRADTPLFVSALVAAMRAAGALRRKGDTWVVNRKTAVTVPPVIRDLVLERLAQLDAAEREVLEWVVSAGDGAHLALLEAAIGRDLATELRTLTEMGLLVETDGVDIGFRPAHPLLAEVTSGELPGTTHRHRHAALERSRPVDVERLAHHYREAGGLLAADRTPGGAAGASRPGTGRARRRRGRHPSRRGR